MKTLFRIVLTAFFMAVVREPQVEVHIYTNPPVNSCDLPAEHQSVNRKK